jgi:hypothetical protein
MLSRDRERAITQLYLRERELDMVFSAHSARSVPIYVDSIALEFAVL